MVTQSMAISYLLVSYIHELKDHTQIETVYHTLSEVQTVTNQSPPIGERYYDESRQLVEASDVVFVDRYLQQLFACLRCAVFNWYHTNFEDSIPLCIV